MSIEDHTAIPSGQTPLNAFMHSGRGRSGKPDTSFFWLLIEGKQCIAKVLTTEQGPHLSDFVKNEQQVLRLLQEKGAPVCKLVEYPSHPEWLVTEFGGLSLALLGGRGSADWPSLPIQEYVSIWAHFLYRARNLANLGAVPLDLAGRNLVVPMGANGQLKLNEAVSIDHAHTVLPSAQLALKRPMWIDSRRNPHLAPELKDALQKDQEKLIHLLAARDAFLPDSTAGLAQGPNGLSARTWLEYSEQQEIQNLVNRGEVDADKVIQFAVGHDIHRRLDANNSWTRELAPVVLRLCAKDPGKRYKKLEDAADALKAALNGQLAMASAYAYQPKLPQDLVPSSPREESLPLIDLSKFASATGIAPFDPSNTADRDGTIIIGPVIDDAAAPSKNEAKRNEAIVTPKQQPERYGHVQRWLWPLLAAALAVVIGIPLGTWLAAP